MSLYVSPYLGSYQISESVGASPTTVAYEYDKTNPAVADYFASQMQVFYDIFLRSSTSPITADDVNNAKSAIQNMINLAKGNLTVNVQNSPTGAPQRFFLTVEMVQSLDLLIRSLQATGISDPTTDLALSSLERWKDFSLITPDIQNALLKGIQSPLTNRSIQSLVEIDYVTAGNELIDNKLSSLESALTLTKNLLSLLTNVQNAKNSVITMDRSSMGEPYPFDTQVASTTAARANFASRYQSFNSGFYTQPQFPIPNSTLILYSNPRIILAAGALPFQATIFAASAIKLENNMIPIGLTSGGLQLFSQLLTYKKQLSAFLPQLFSSLGPSVAADPSSLYSRANTVLQNMKTLFVGGNANSVVQAENLTSASDKSLALFRWLTDSNAIKESLKTGALNPGDAQNSLSLAITSAEGLNDTQKESVRNFMFVFEEFYKSASAVLQRISQMIEKMASNISR